MKFICWRSVHQTHKAQILKRWEKMFYLQGLLLSDFSKSPHTHFFTCSPPLVPTCVSHTLLDHQQGLARRSASRVSFIHMTSKRANQLMSSKPRECLCGTSHTTSIHCAEADWVTEQCSGNITKTLLNFCLWLSLYHCPCWCVLCSPSLPTFHESKPAERATQTQQLLRPSLA